MDGLLLWKSTGGGNSEAESYKGGGGIKRENIIEKKWENLLGSIVGVSTSEREILKFQGWDCIALQRMGRGRHGWKKVKKISGELS